MRSRQSFSYPNSQAACLKQFGGNWMKRNKWVNIAVYGWLSQTHRQWLEAHSPLYAHSKKITEFHSNLAPNRRRTCSGLGCQLCHLLIFIWRKNKTDFFLFYFKQSVSQFKVGFPGFHPLLAELQRNGGGKNTAYTSATSLPFLPHPFAPQIVLNKAVCTAGPLLALSVLTPRLLLHLFTISLVEQNQIQRVDKMSMS